VRAVMITGRGRGFCAGADLESGGDTFDIAAGSPATGSNGPGRVHRDEGGLLTLRLYSCTKPLIAAINGPAVGVGVTMTLPMDIRLASETARFGFVFARRGIVPEACSSWFLPRVVGINTALEWTMTGRVFDAAEALERGLVRSVHAPDDLLPAAYEIAREIAEHTSAVSVAMTRQMLWRMLGADHPMAAHRIDSPAIANLGRSHDAREGVLSFLEKRPPAFTDQVPDDIPGPWPFWTEPEF
jgi:enoyl-CoA hydratase/carnithine racemase